MSFLPAFVIPVCKLKSRQQGFACISTSPVCTSINSFFHLSLFQVSLRPNLIIQIKCHQTSVTTPPLYKEKCITDVITGFVIKVTIVSLQYNHPDFEIVANIFSYFHSLTVLGLGQTSNFS